MAWSETSGAISGGAWESFTPTFSNGSNQWDASNYSASARYTVVEGTVYLIGSFTLSAGTNYGTGVDPWQFWPPTTVPAYADYAAGSRLIGGGFVYTDNLWKIAHLKMNAVNTYDAFFYFDMIKYYAAGTGNWNGGYWNRTDFKRSELSTLAGGTGAIYAKWYMRYTAKTNY